MNYHIMYRVLQHLKFHFLYSLVRVNGPIAGGFRSQETVNVQLRTHHLVRTVATIPGASVITEQLVIDACFYKEAHN